MEKMERHNNEEENTENLSCVVIFLQIIPALPQAKTNNALVTVNAPNLLKGNKAT